MTGESSSTDLNSWSESMHEFVIQFDEEWKKGCRPSISDWLVEVSVEAHRPTTVRELLHVEFEHRINDGEIPSIAEYKNALPNYTEIIDEVYYKYLPCLPPRWQQKKGSA